MQVSVPNRDGARATALEHPIEDVAAEDLSVTRHIDQGFAIEFDHLDPNAIDYIDNCAAVVPARRRGRPSDR